MRARRFLEKDLLWSFGLDLEDALIVIVCVCVFLCVYFLHFTLNTTPPPGRVYSPNRAAVVAIASSGE